MITEEQRAFGALVADLRKQRGMTQGELAAELGRTSSWLSQVERGVQPVARLDVLRRLADGLGVSVQALQPDSPIAPETPVRDEAVLPSNDLDQARLVISGHPVPEVLLSGRPLPRR
ncbi:helix-turn-helix domain-containing protein [Dactylosporangium cerinum]